MVETPYTLALAATFAAAPLSETLRFWIRESGIARDLVVAPPDQLLEHLREADGVLRSASVDLGVAAVRFSDLCRDGHDVGTWISDFGNAVRSSRRTTPLLIVRCAEALETPRDRQWEERLRQAVTDAPGVEFAAADEVVEFYPGGDSAGGSAYTDDEYSAALGTAIARRVHARRMRRRSVLVLDCDGTLWRGPCGDVLPREMPVDDSHQAVQQWARDRADQGWTLALFGRCDARYVRRVFDAHPEWPLRLTDFGAITVGWDSKATQIGRLTREIGAHVHDIVVIDDDRDDCRSVRSAHPDIVALRLPAGGREARALLRHVWAFDRAPADLRPRQRSAAVTLSEGRAPRIGLRLAATEDFPAVASLSQRAARLNASGTRVSVKELAWFAGEPGRAVLLVSAGSPPAPIAAARTRDVAGAVRVEDWWMDHDLPEGVVEGHMLRALGRMAVAAGVERIEIACLRTRATEPVRRLLEERGARCLEHELEISFAAALGSVDVENPCTSCHSGPSTERPSIREVGPAVSIQTPARLLRALRAPNTSAPSPVPAPFRLPTTDAERWVSGVWREVLDVERVGAQDDFFALGGDSLAATRAMSRIRAAFGVDLPITALYEEPTLAAQAARLVSARLAGSEPSVVQGLFEEEGLTEPTDD